MKRLFEIFLLIIFTLFPILGEERAPLSSILPILEAYIDQAMKAEGVPGAAVVVVKDGKIVCIKGFGVKVIGQNAPIDDHAPFALASVTKTFTNTLAARLVDQGKLRWTDKVSQYLPDFRLIDPDVSQEIRIEDLLSHRSGLAGYAGDTLIELGWRASEIIPQMKEFPMEGEFRKTYDYQNVLVGLVGVIMEKATGKPLSQLFKEEVFEPAGLTETWIGEPPCDGLWCKLWNIFRKQEPQPTFHDVFQGKTRVLPKGNPGLYTFPASSGIISSGRDLGKWMIFQLNEAVVNGKTVVSASNLNEMRRPRVDAQKAIGYRQFPKSRVTKVAYGMGWFIHDYAGVSMLSHMGGMAGARALVLIIPQDNVGIAILANLGGMRVSLFPEAIRNKFLDLYLNVKDDQDWAANLRESIRNSRQKYESERQTEMLQNLASARNLDDYAGTYENALYGRLDIGKADDALVLTYRDRPKVKLSHWNANIFQFNGSEISSGFSGTDLGEIAFTSEKGKSDRLMINLFHEGTDSVFHRAP